MPSSNRLSCRPSRRLRVTTTRGEGDNESRGHISSHSALHAASQRWWSLLPTIALPIRYFRFGGGLVQPYKTLAVVLALLLFVSIGPSAACQEVPPTPIPLKGPTMGTVMFRTLRTPGLPANAKFAITLPSPRSRSRHHSRPAPIVTPSLPRHPCAPACSRLFTIPPPPRAYVSPVIEPRTLKGSPLL